MAHLASSMQDFQVGTRTRLIRDLYSGGKVWAAAGCDGVVTDAVRTKHMLSVCFGDGRIWNLSTPSDVAKVGADPWAIGAPVRAVKTLKYSIDGPEMQAGSEGTAVTLPVEVSQITIKFVNTPTGVCLCDDFVLADVLIIGPQEPPAAGSAPAAPAVPAPGATAAGLPARRQNRWGDGLDAPAAGARDFFPPGWTPSLDVYEAIKRFGHPDEAIAHIRDKGERLERELAGLGVPTVVEYAAAVYAYTMEDPVNDLYGKLNLACRTSGSLAEKRLAAYREYIFHLQEALSTLPSFPGRVYRGTDCKVSPVSYATGNKVTWQQFASASRSQQVARKFVAEHKGQLSGSYFILDVKNGKEVDALSEFPLEEEVLLKPNTFFTVVEKVEGEAAKKAALEQLAGYDLNQLEVYVLKQL